MRLPLPELHIQPLDIPRIQTFIRQYLEADNAHQLGEQASKLFWEIGGGQSVRHVWEVWEKLGASHEQFWEGEDIPHENPNVYSKTTGSHDQVWREKIRDNPHNLMRLARNPYLLTMLMFVYGQHGEIPDNRGKLLAAFFTELVNREIDPDEPKNNNELLQDGGKQLEALIGKLAWAMRVQTSAVQRDALTVMGHDERWLKLAISCNVLEQIGDNIRFSHQLLQDYFIAVGMKQRLDACELPVERFWQQQANWWESNGWEEPVILLAGLYQDCTPVVEWLAQANPKLAARCIRDSGVACSDVTKAKLREPWQERLTNLATDPNPYARAAIGTALAWVELHGRPLDQRKGVGLDSNGLPDIDWVEIPNGEFIYQNSEARTLPTFKVSRYPVTNAQFQAFVADGGYEVEAWWQGLEKPETVHEPYWKESNRPVEQVDWYESIAFCRWLSHKVQMNICLPTEEQWEKAARGVNGREYPWGNGYKTGYANICEKVGGVGTYYLQETSAVGLYPHSQSPYGLIDMAGNVWEWCLNKWDDPNDISAVISNSGRVVRGNSWLGDSEHCRSSSCSFRHPLNRNGHQGFRLVLCFHSSH